MRRVEPAADASGQVYEVRIAPGRPTLLSFDAPLRRDGVELEGQEHFVRVAVTEDVLALLPSGAVLPGEAFALTVHYLDGQAPGSERFRLVVVPPSQSESYVEVFRRPLSIEFFRQKEREARAETLRCQAALARACEGGDFADSIVAGRVDERGVPAKDIRGSISVRPGSTLKVARAISYRMTSVPADGEVPRGRVFLLLELGFREPDAPPWMAASAELVGPEGARWRAAISQPEPVHGGRRSSRVVLEAEMTEEEARGVFTLTLEESGGTRRMTLGGVTFP